MGVSVRLKRQGSNQKPFYRVVVGPSQRTTQGMACESLGMWDPLAKKDPVKIDVARIEEWRRRGACVSPSVARLVAQVKGATKTG